jgi:UDP-N-acetylmuramyl pentapeptide phosphotransferase/UDP-N-acetylglucosamine-1-phosphate transferase
VLGAVVACGAIIGNMEKIVVITMAPFIIQGILKFYAKLKIGHFPSDLGILQRDGTIKSKYGKNIYSWTHLVMNLGKFSEKQITLIMMGIQALFSIIPFLKII